MEFPHMNRSNNETRASPMVVAAEFKAWPARPHLDRSARTKNRPGERVLLKLASTPVNIWDGVGDVGPSGHAGSLPGVEQCSFLTS
jgi:hypothetical protein